MDIKIYITTENQWCKQLKTWLKKKRYAFEILDLDESDKARSELLEKSNQMAMPVTSINDEIIIGFQLDKIEAAITKAKEKFDLAKD